MSACAISCLARLRDEEADEEAAEEDGREAERPWLANHIMVKIIDKKLRSGRCVLGNLQMVEPFGTASCRRVLMAALG